MKKNILGIGGLGLLWLFVFCFFTTPQVRPTEAVASPSATPEE